MATRSPHVYDKAKYHDETVRELELPEEHASSHTVPFLRWLIENELMSELFLTEGRGALDRYREGEIDIHGLYEWWDTCLISDMLSDHGNAFAIHYFDFERGQYLADFRETLQGDLPTEFHVAYSEENYSKLKPVIDRRYAAWKLRKDDPPPGPARPWWRFWR